MKLLVYFAYLLFFVNPFLSLIIIFPGLIVDRKNNIHYSILFAALLSFFAYWINPLHEMDLVRYFQQVSRLNGLSWDQFVDNFLFYDFLFIKNLLFYFINLTGDVHLLPTATIFVIYFILFYIVTDFWKKENKGNFYLILCILFIISYLPFISIVSNVRNVLAFALINLAFYREFVQKKKGIVTIFLYILPLFIHVSSLVLILVRFLIKNSFKINAKKLIFSFLGVTIIVLMALFFNNIAEFQYINVYIGDFVNKAFGYYSDSVSETFVSNLRSSTFSKIQKYYYIGTVVFLLGIFILMPKNKKYIEVNRFYLWISIIIFSTIPVVLTIYWRFSFVLMFFVVIIFSSLEKSEYKKFQYVIVYFIFVLMIGGLFIQLEFFSHLASYQETFKNVIWRSFFNMFENYNQY